MGEKDPNPRPALLRDQGATVDEHGRGACSLAATLAC